MKITISHDQESVDPSATYTAEQFEDVLDSLETAYLDALKKEFPDSEIEFVRSSDPRSIRVTDTDEEASDPSYIEDAVHQICELVFATGNFWTDGGDWAAIEREASKGRYDEEVLKA